jgi:hypothetical protein
MSLARLTPGVVCNMTATNTRGRSEFQVRAQMPRNSLASLAKKRRPTFPFGTE